MQVNFSGAPWRPPNALTRARSGWPSSVSVEQMIERARLLLPTLPPFATLARAAADPGAVREVDARQIEADVRSLSPWDPTLVFCNYLQLSASTDPNSHLTAVTLSRRWHRGCGRHRASE
mgnify:CR=1 FL=1